MRLTKYIRERRRKSIPETQTPPYRAAAPVLGFRRFHTGQVEIIVSD